MKQLFYTYRELLFDKKIAKIAKRSGNLYIYDRDLADEEESVVVTGYEVVTPYPNEMCPTSDDKHSVLVHLACTDAVAWMHYSIKFILTST